MLETTLTVENFEDEVLNSDIPVLVDFWAVWCGPCMEFAPVLEEIAKKYEGKVKLGKVNVDEQISLAQKYGISSIPTVILFKDKKKVGTSVGLISSREVEDFIKPVL